jgi:hypothetical protein
MNFTIDLFISLYPKTQRQSLLNTSLFAKRICKSIQTLFFFTCTHLDGRTTRRPLSPLEEAISMLFSPLFYRSGDNVFGGNRKVFVHVLLWISVLDELIDLNLLTQTCNTCRLNGIHHSVWKQRPDDTTT